MRETNDAETGNDGFNEALKPSGIKRKSGAETMRVRQTVRYEPQLQSASSKGAQKHGEKAIDHYFLLFFLLILLFKVADAAPFEDVGSSSPPMSLGISSSPLALPTLILPDLTLPLSSFELDPRPVSLF